MEAFADEQEDGELRGLCEQAQREQAQREQAQRELALVDHDMSVRYFAAGTAVPPTGA